MITLATVLGGGFVHGLAAGIDWTYLTFLSFSTISTMIGGILMIFDSCSQKVENQVKQILDKQDEDPTDSLLEKKQKEKLEFLAKLSEDLKPDDLTKSS